jgi:hypothetical protein
MKKLLVIAIAIGTLASCKKKDETPAQLDVTVANIAGAYKLTGEIEKIGNNNFDRFNGGSMNGLTYPSDYDACEKDDVYTISLASILSISEGATSCTPPNSEPPLDFTVNTAAKTITIMGEIATVKSLTSKTMVVEISESSNGVTSTITFTYTK